MGSLQPPPPMMIPLSLSTATTEQHIHSEWEALDAFRQTLAAEWQTLIDAKQTIVAANDAERNASLGSKDSAWGCSGPMPQGLPVPKTIFQLSPIQPPVIIRCPEAPDGQWLADPDIAQAEARLALLTSTVDSLEKVSE